jgi:hypothetical protein
MSLSWDDPVLGAARAEEKSEDRRRRGAVKRMGGDNRKSRRVSRRPGRRKEESRREDSYILMPFRGPCGLFSPLRTTMRSEPERESQDSLVPWPPINKVAAAPRGELIRRRPRRGDQGTGKGEAP